MKKQHKDPAFRPAVARGIPLALVEILLACLPVDEEALTPGSTLVGDLEADSLDLVEIAMDCERHFKVSIDDAIAERWETGTVGELLVDLRKLGARV